MHNACVRFRSRVPPRNQTWNEDKTYSSPHHCKTFLLVAVPFFPSFVNYQPSLLSRCQPNFLEKLLLRAGQPLHRVISYSKLLLLFRCGAVAALLSKLWVCVGTVWLWHVCRLIKPVFLNIVFRHSWKISRESIPLHLNIF